MVKIYGNRWEITASFSRGGQGETFRVRDIHDLFQEELVLKKLINPKQYDRFKIEVDSATRLKQTNIVRL